MRKFLTVLIILLMAGSLPVSASASAGQAELPVVHAVLFWSNGCPYCTQVISQVLPSVQDKYGAQLNILLIELATLKDIDSLYSLGKSLGLTKEQVSVPFLLIDHSALVGVDDIQSRMPGLVDQYLAKGGMAYPDFPLLSDMLTGGIPYTSSFASLHLVPPSSTSNQATGMALAWLVMALMLIAIMIAVIAILRAFNGKPLRELHPQLDHAIPVMSILGLGVSIYLTYVELTHTRALCGPVGDCNAVQSSPYAKLFGFLPIGILGALGYIAFLVVWLWRRRKPVGQTPLAGPIMFAMALFGVLFSIYLTYLELFVIHAVCIWCLSSAVLITALELLSLPSFTQWLAVLDEED